MILFLLLCCSLCRKWRTWEAVNCMANFLFNLAWGDAVIVAPESIDDIKTNPVGTGAFKFANWVQGDKIELEKNADYWPLNILFGPMNILFTAVLRTVS